MNNRIIFAILFIAAIGLIGFYVLDLGITGGGDTTGGIEAEGRAGEQLTDNGQMINIEEEIERTRYLQERRRGIMDEMIAGGLASRIENPVGEPFIYVLKPFYRLSVDEQTSLLKVIWYYYMTLDRDSGVLTIYNEDTGQEIGTYTASGLLMGE